MQLFVEDYCSGISEPIQTRMRANQERRWRKNLEYTFNNLRDHTCRFTRPVITFQQIHLGLVSPSNCLVARRHTALEVRRAVQKINRHLRSKNLSPIRVAALS